MERWSRLILAALVLVSVMSCTDVYVVHHRSRQGIALVGLPPRSRVYVDGRYVGVGRVLDRVRLYLEPGKHRVVVKDEAHYPFFWEVRLPKGKLVVRRVDMKPVVDE